MAWFWAMIACCQQFAHPWWVGSWFGLLSAARLALLAARLAVLVAAVLAFIGWSSCWWAVAAAGCASIKTHLAALVK
jgi:hypothetical protein